jgi:membrane protein YdbS with pleckstrin-like domain
MNKLKKIIIAIFHEHKTAFVICFIIFCALLFINKPFTISVAKLYAFLYITLVIIGIIPIIYDNLKNKK